MTSTRHRLSAAHPRDPALLPGAHPAASDGWTNVSGSWQVAGNWTSGVPGAAANVSLSSSMPEAVTYDSGTSTIASFVSTTDSLTINAGKLSVTGSTNVGAALTIAGGQLAINGGGTATAAIMMTTGTLSIGSGTIFLAKAAFAVDASTTGATSVITGPGTLTTAGGGSLADSGVGLTLGARAYWVNTGVFSDAGAIGLGVASDTSTVTIGNTASGVFNLTTDEAGFVAGNEGTGFAAIFSNGGLLAKTAGTGDSQFAATLNNTGTIAVNTGSLSLTGGGSLGGSITGTGTLVLAGGTYTPSAVMAASATLMEENATIKLAASGTDTLAGNVVLNGNSFITLAAGAKLTLSGAVTSDGSPTGSNTAIGGPGTFATAGTTNFVDYGVSTLFGTGVTWANSGTVLDAGQIGLGLSGETTSATVTNTGTFDFTTDDGSFVPSNQGAGFTAVFNNAGVLGKTGGTATSVFHMAINNTGTLNDTSGSLALYGGGTLGGTITGNGTLVLAGGTFAPSAVMAASANLLEENATIQLAAQTSDTLAGSIALAGNSFITVGTGAILTLAGTVTSDGTPTGSNTAIGGAGTFATAGTTTFVDYGVSTLFGAGVTWANSGTVLDAGKIGLGLAGETTGVTIANTGTFDFTTDDGSLVVSNQGAGFVATFNNAGVLGKTGGTGTSTVNAMLNNTGTINDTSGTLSVTQGGALGGSITGTGTLVLAGGTFTPSAVMAVNANLELENATIQLAANGSDTLAGNVDLAGNSAITLAAGARLTLSGSVTSDGSPTGSNTAIGGPGTFATSGTTSFVDYGVSTLFGAGVTWANSGTVLDAGNIALGLAGETTGVTIANTGTFDLTTDNGGLTPGNQGAGFTAVFNNAGVLSKTGGGSTSHIYAVVNNTTGTITATAGSIELDGGGTLGGTVGAGKNGAVVLANSTTFTAAGLTVSDNGTVAALTLNGATLTNTGVSTLAGKLLLEGSGTLTNAAGGTLNLSTADATFTLTNSGNVIANAGLLRDTAAAPLSLTVGLANTGTIDAAAGALKVANITGTGTLQVEAGATLEISTGIATTQSYAFGGGGGATLLQDKAASITTPIAGLGAGDRIDLAGTTVTAAAISGSTLTLTAGSKSYSYVGAASLVGLGTSIASDGKGGTVVALDRSASATATPQPVAFGNLHVGDTETLALSVTNSARADGYSETLDGKISGVTAPVTASGTISMLAAGQTSMALKLVAPATLSAGAIGGTATLSLSSDGTGIDNRGTTALPSQTLTLTGGVYRLATASVGSTVNFGVVHVTDTAAMTLSLTNTDAADTYSEALDAMFAATGAGVTGSGAVSMLAAGATDTTDLKLALNTATSGVITAAATLGLTSDGAGIDGLGTTTLSNQVINVTGTVDTYAIATLEDPNGPAITTSGVNSYVLNLGTFNVGDTATTALGVLNSATGLSDLLGGTISTAGAAGFTNTGFGGFSGLAAGQDEHVQGITLSTATAGTFTETVTLTSSGSNTSGYNGMLATETLTVTGTVISSGGTYTLAQGPNTIVGAGGNDVFIAAGNGALNSRDSLTGSTGGQNVLQLTGGGLFDINAPGTFANIGTIMAVEGQAPKGAAADTRQTLLLRDGTAEQVLVANGTPAQGNTNPETITIYGGSNTDTIRLGTGSDVVYLGGTGEIVHGGGGADTIYATSATIGATVDGGTGKSTLRLTGGGNVKIGASITNIATLALSAASAAYVVNAGTMAGLAIVGSGAADTITLGAANQSVNANGGAVHVLATATLARDAVIGAQGATLELTTGGVAQIGATDTNLTIKLDAATTLTLNKTGFLTAIGSSGADTLTAGGAGQTLTGGGGADSLVGAAAFGDFFVDTAAGLNGDSITNFGGSDRIDVTDLMFSALTDSYSGGKLSLSDGTHSASIGFSGGNYALSNFTFANDTHGGTFITFH